MAKSLSSIMSQIERLQKEAATIQSEVVSRIRKDIAKFGLTADQLFGAGTGRRGGKGAASKSPRAAKYADATGNTWGGMGKRPEWLRQALAAGKQLEEFLVAKMTGQEAPAAPAAPATRKRAAKAAPAKKAGRPAAKKAAKPAATRKPRGKAAATNAG